MQFQSCIAFPFDEAGTALLASPIVLATLRFQISDLQDRFWASWRGPLFGADAYTIRVGLLDRRRQLEVR